MQTASAWMERNQVALYLAAIAIGSAVGLLAPASAGWLSAGIDPALALLLFATFLGVPFTRVGAALRDRRFLGTVVVVNFVVVPVVVLALSRLVSADDAALFGVLLVLLAPCVDYVIVFTRIAGGAADRLIAAAPLLMLLQLAALPILVSVLAGPQIAASIDPRAFLRALVVIIIVPLALAWATQAAGRAGWRPARVVEGTAQRLMVPLMMLVLALVVGSQLHRVAGRLTDLVAPAALFVAFAAIMTVLGALSARAARLDPAGRRAVVFSAVTRNSLVVLPIALAAPGSLTPLVVVTQTLVELVVMILLIRVVPRIVRSDVDAPAA